MTIGFVQVVFRAVRGEPRPARGCASARSAGSARYIDDDGSLAPATVARELAEQRDRRRGLLDARP
jgi:hypothetical protein